MRALARFLHQTDYRQYSRMRPLDKQTKQVVYNVYQFFANLEIEGDVDALINKLKAVHRVAAVACGISDKTLRRVVNEKLAADELGEENGGRSSPFSDPRTRCSHDNWVTRLDDFDTSTVRKMALDYVENGEYPASAKIADRMYTDLNLTISPSSARRVLKTAGFRHLRTMDGKNHLLEEADIVAHRTQFLEKMHSLKVNKDTRPVVYLAEAWINESHTKYAEWADVPEPGELRTKFRKGSRLIVVLAASEKLGFIRDAEVVFRTKCAKEHHDEFNVDAFKIWFIKLLLSLDEGCIIVMDQTQYNCKRKIKETDHVWWTKKNFQRLAKSSMNELDAIPMEERKLLMELELHQMANFFGHELICPPPYHSHYNPIASIWYQMKKYVSENNSTGQLEDVEDHFYDALSMVTPEDWEKSVGQTHKTLAEDFLKEGVSDSVVEELVINSFKSEPFSSSDDELY